ncbi:MAG: NADPH-dependent F420 reductase [Hyphomonadaceae bacterium]|nr:NADPH-dependent F420 reductase [Hyphomonadaceae bacterium]
MASDKPALAVVGGTGTLGSGLAKRWAAAGYPVIIGSRDAGKAEAAARTLAAGAGAPAPRGASNQDAAKAGEVVILTVPWSNHAPILAEIKAHVAGKIVVDATVPLVPPKVARVQLPAETSAALAAQQRLGDQARVVAAFHNVAAHKLQLDQPIDCDVLVCGDDPKDRAVAVALAQAAGLRGVHAGPLANAVAAEALTSVLIGINRTYKVDGAGIRITGIGKD